MRFLIPLAALALLAGCSRKAATEVQAASNPAAPPAVKTAAVEMRRVERSIAVTGSLMADDTVNLSLEVPGTVSRVTVDFGQTFRKGQVLAELDTRELTLQAERSRAALAQALARVGLRPADLDASPESTPAIRQAAAQAEDARSKYDSAARLVKSGDISRERYTELEKAWHARDAALQAARDDLRMQLAAIDALKADYRLAQKRLSDATLRAPFDGAVNARLVSPGQYIKENVTVLTVVKAGPLRLRADIPESAVAQVRPGTSLTFTTDAAPGAAFHAIVRELNPALDPRSRSLTAEARLVEPDARLKPGMFVQVQIVVARNLEVPVVPRQALYTVAGLTKVFVIRNGAVVEIRVPPGQEIGGFIEVPSDLKPGDRVATSHLGSLVNGMKVAVEG